MVSHNLAPSQKSSITPARLHLWRIAAMLALVVGVFVVMLLILTNAA